MTLSPSSAIKLKCTQATFTFITYFMSFVSEGVPAGIPDGADLWLLHHMEAGTAGLYFPAPFAVRGAVCPVLPVAHEAPR